MRNPFGVIFFLALLLLVGVYWLSEVAESCDIPIEYSIGTFDERFGVSEDYALAAIKEAESVWEDALGAELFTYTPEASFTINFIYDERQQTADQENIFRELLDKKAEVNEKLEVTYSELVTRYEELESIYQENKDAYDARLNAYNEKVDKYNSEGGAPPEVYKELQDEQKSLRKEEEQLNAEVRQLNEYVEEINRLGEQGTALIEKYNENVASYNQAYGQLREFTQGDYQGALINIYTFDDRNELVTVLAHEFGHALSIDHIENEASVMYYLMGGQSVPATLTNEDMEAFVAQCEPEGGWLDQLKWRINDWY